MVTMGAVLFVLVATTGEEGGVEVEDSTATDETDEMD